MKPKAELPECPVATSVELIGNKWKLLKYGGENGDAPVLSKTGKARKKQDKILLFL